MVAELWVNNPTRRLLEPSVDDKKKVVVKALTEDSQEVPRCRMTGRNLTQVVNKDQPSAQKLTGRFPFTATTGYRSRGASFSLLFLFFFVFFFW